MGMFDFFGGGTDAVNTNIQPDMNDISMAGVNEWIQKNPAQFAALMGTGAKAIDPTGETMGGAVGSAISGMAQSKIMADKAAQDAALRKSLMEKLGLTPPGQPGPTAVSAKVGPDGQMTTTTVETPSNKPKQYDIPSVFGSGGASNFL